MLLAHLLTLIIFLPAIFLFIILLFGGMVLITLILDFILSIFINVEEPPKKERKRTPNIYSNKPANNK